MEITFYGRVCDGAGRFSEEIILPSPIDGLKSVKNWPSELTRGTFNFQVESSGWPDVSGFDFKSKGVQCLDRSDILKPALYLDHSFVPNNTLHPGNRGEFGEDLQFWKAILQIEGINKGLQCYMLRRVKSSYRDKIEIVSDIHIRTENNVGNGHKVKFTVYDGCT